ncbi:hypothetical protein GCM10010211_19610 [Streptomyces albospinus]|uniref:DUF3592 domain-containing protein n=1 Tax=Streptomyces albospinus TaxID=285515 RepID=A0ABQ2UUS1_9ACTN|nr:DUF3592 domain-containing protein [Streptomyces albospinus]GGU55002.1 hypothetical protein GCM10010211_19610 [Streptomyces albospinus]
MSLCPAQTTMFWVGLAVLAAFGTLCFFLSRQLIGRLRSVTSGITAEGRCIRRYASEGSEGNTYWHHVHAFTTLDGQYVEFEEDAVLLAQGDTVTVRYRPSNPARSATIMGAGGTWSPLFGSLFGILISGIFTAFGALFVVLSFTP